MTNVLKTVNTLFELAHQLDPEGKILTQEDYEKHRYGALDKLPIKKQEAILELTNHLIMQDGSNRRTVAEIEFAFDEKKAKNNFNKFRIGIDGIYCQELKLTGTNGIVSFSEEKCLIDEVSIACIAGRVILDTGCLTNRTIQYLYLDTHHITIKKGAIGGYMNRISPWAMKLKWYLNTEKLYRGGRAHITIEDDAFNGNDYTTPADAIDHEDRVISIAQFVNENLHTTAAIVAINPNAFGNGERILNELMSMEIINYDWPLHIEKQRQLLEQQKNKDQQWEQIQAAELHEEQAVRRPNWRRNPKPNLNKYQPFKWQPVQNQEEVHNPRYMRN